MRKKLLQTSGLVSMLVLTMTCPAMNVHATEVTESEQAETVTAEDDILVDDEEGWVDDEEEAEEDEETSSEEESTEEASDESLPDEWADDEIWDEEEDAYEAAEAISNDASKQTWNRSASQNNSKKNTTVKTKASGSYDRSFRTGVQEHMAWIVSSAAALLILAGACMTWAYRIKKTAREELRAINRSEQDRTN